MHLATRLDRYSLRTVYEHIKLSTLHKDRHKGCYLIWVRARGSN
jgi:hypothetical protein